MWMLAPDGRPDLRYFLGRPAKPVEPRHQRGVQGYRDSNRRGRNGCSRALRLTVALRFQHRLGHFLYEQRNTIGPLDDVLPEVRGKLLVASDAVDHRVHFGPRQPIDGEGDDVRLSDPLRLEFRPEGYE